MRFFHIKICNVNPSYLSQIVWTEKSELHISPRTQWHMITWWYFWFVRRWFSFRIPENRKQILRKHSIYGINVNGHILFNLLFIALFNKFASNKRRWFILYMKSLDPYNKIVFRLLKCYHSIFQWIRKISWIEVKLNWVQSPIRAFTFLWHTSSQTCVKAENVWGSVSEVLRLMFEVHCHNCSYFSCVYLNI